MTLGAFAVLVLLAIGYLAFAREPLRRSNPSAERAATIAIIAVVVLALLSVLGVFGSLARVD